MESSSVELLEPIMKVEVSAPSEFLSDVLILVGQLRGDVQEQEVTDDYSTVVFEIPLNDMFGFASILRSSTEVGANGFFIC